jgi:mono/diheme cytochrome c family protein
MLSKLLVRFFVCGWTLLGLCALGDDKDKAPIDPKLLPPVSAKQGVTYAADIQPLFAKSCYPCHGPKTAKPKGKLRLDTLEAVLKGGEDGPALIQGDSAKSVMVAQISQLGDPDDYMPPPKNKANAQPLTKEQIGLVRAWIDQGAK